MALWRWDELQAAAKKAGVAWPYATSKRAEFEAYKALIQKFNISEISEDSSERNMSSFEKALFPPTSN